MCLYIFDIALFTGLIPVYNPFLVYCRELAPSTVGLTGDRAQGDDSKHDSHYTIILLYIHFAISKICDWSFTGRIHVAGPYKYCLETTCDLGSRSQVLDMFKTLRPAHFHAVCSHDHSRSIKNQRATVLHLIFAFLSSLIVKAPKSF